MTLNLTGLVVETGLVQFGRFQDRMGTRPFLLNLDYLPAYPHVLKTIAQVAQQLLDGFTIDRFVVTVEALPFGVATSLQTDISLVYSRGTNREAVYDFAGAYNIGHAAVLLVNILEDTQPLVPFIASARRVGLEIHTLLAVLDLDTATPIPDVDIHSIITLSTMIHKLSTQGVLPEGQANAVTAWIEEHRSKYKHRENNGCFP